VKGLSKTKPGQTYSVYCTIHRGMTGMLVVAG
jgi:plastocyanin